MGDPNSFDVEIWRPINGTNGRYEASNFGRVRAMFVPLVGRPRGNANPIDGEVLKPFPRQSYPLVHLDLGPRTEDWSVAACVLSAFDRQRPSPKHRACYLDGDKRNAHVTNLAWLSPKQSKDLTAQLGRSRRRPTRLVGPVVQYQCTKCHEWLPARGFYKLKGGESRLGNRLTHCGLQSECRDCANQRRREYRQTHGDGGAPSLLEKVLPLLETLDGQKVPPDELARANIPGRLVALRARFGWSRLELSRRAGLHPQTLDMIETGVNVPREQTIRKIMTAMSLPEPSNVGDTREGKFT